MRKFTVTTTISRHGVEYRVRRPSKPIQLGDLIEFNFITHTVKAVARPWDTYMTCKNCALYHETDKPTRCVNFTDSDGSDILLCNSNRGESFVFSSIDGLMEEV